MALSREEVGKRVALARELRDLRQVDLHDDLVAAGFGKHDISKIERGDPKMPLNRARRDFLVERLDVPAWFFTAELSSDAEPEPSAVAQLEDRLRAIEAELQGEQARSEHMRSQIDLLVSRSEPGANEQR